MIMASSSSSRGDNHSSSSSSGSSSSSSGGSRGDNNSSSSNRNNSNSNDNSYQSRSYDHELGYSDFDNDNSYQNRSNDNDIEYIESKKQYSSLCHYISFIILISSIVSIGIMSQSSFGFNDTSINSDNNRNTNIMHITKLDDLPKDILFANFSEPEQMKAFSLFIDKFGKIYSKDEYGDKFKAFKMSLDKIDKRNNAESARGSTRNIARHGITKFSDMTSEEFASKYLTAKKGDKLEEEEVDLPIVKMASIEPYGGSLTDVDWSDVYTTKIRDQGYCGSCWAISAASQVESDAIIAGYWSKDKQLSVQQMLECDDADFKCQGGWTESAFDYIKNNGLETEDDYPYTAYYADTETCGDSKNYVLGIEDFYTVANEDQLVDYVLGTGPISACVDSSTWDTYVDGVITDCGNDVDHCVQIVGVNVKESYWKIRNTWGEDWGEDGYIRIELGTNACGITTDPIYTVPKLINSEPTISTTSSPTSVSVTLSPTPASQPTNSNITVSSNTTFIVSSASPTPVTAVITSTPTLIPTIATSPYPTLISTIATSSFPTLIPTLITVTESPTPTTAEEPTPTRTHTRSPTEAPTKSPVLEDLSTPVIEEITSPVIEDSTTVIVDSTIPVIEDTTVIDSTTPVIVSDADYSTPSSSVVSSPSSTLLSPSTVLLSPSSSTLLSPSSTLLPEETASQTSKLKSKSKSKSKPNADSK